jgi:hypothetical protein
MLARCHHRGKIAIVVIVGMLNWGLITPTKETQTVLLLFRCCREGGIRAHVEFIALKGKVTREDVKQGLVASGGRI